MRTLGLISLMTALAGCAALPPPTGPAAAAVPTVAPALPTGAIAEASGYATLLSAPPSPPRRRTPLGSAPVEGDERYRNPDEAEMRDAQTLDRRLKASEAGNYIGYRVVRDPAPRFAFQFRRDAAATLARHSRDPRFTAREGGVPAAELQPIFDEWFPRFVAHRLVGGGSVQAFDGVVAFDMTIDEARFRQLAAEEGWSLPERLMLNFGPPPNPRAIDPALAPLVRIFPRSDRLPGAVNQAALSGRIILRDGCFRLADHGDEGEPLVLFDRDAELGLDAENHLILMDGTTTRIGERVIWAGPRGASEDDAGVKALRAQCGGGRIIPIGAPNSAADFPPRS